MFLCNITYPNIHLINNYIEEMSNKFQQYSALYKNIPESNNYQHNVFIVDHLIKNTA